MGSSQTRTIYCFYMGAPDVKYNRGREIKRSAHSCRQVAPTRCSLTECEVDGSWCLILVLARGLLAGLTLGMDMDRFVAW